MALKTLVIEDCEREKLEAIVSWNPHSLLGPLSSARVQRTPLTPGDSESFSTVNAFHLAPPKLFAKNLANLLFPSGIYQETCNLDSGYIRADILVEVANFSRESPDLSLTKHLTADVNSPD